MDNGEQGFRPPEPPKKEVKSTPLPKRLLDSLRKKQAAVTAAAIGIPSALLGVGLSKILHANNPPPNPEQTSGNSAYVQESTIPPHPIATEIGEARAKRGFIASTLLREPEYPSTIALTDLSKNPEKYVGKQVLFDGTLVAESKQTYLVQYETRNPVRDSLAGLPGSTGDAIKGSTYPPIVTTREESDVIYRVTQNDATLVAFQHIIGDPAKDEEAKQQLIGNKEAFSGNTAATTQSPQRQFEVLAYVHRPSPEKPNTPFIQIQKTSPLVQRG